MTSFRGKYIILILLTGIITAFQMLFVDKALTFLTFAYLWLSQIFAPVIFVGLFLIIFWVAGKKITNKVVFSSYLIFWLIEITLGFILIFSGNYDTYI